MLSVNVCRTTLDEFRQHIRVDGSGEAILTRAEQIEVHRLIDRLYEILYAAKERKPQMKLF